MKPILLSVVLLALAVAAWAEEAKPAARPAESPALRRLPPLDPSKLEAHSQRQEEEDLTDAEHGVFIHIVREKRKGAPEEFWRREISEWGMEPGVKYEVEPIVLDDKVIIYKTRQSAETFRYLLSNPSLPVSVRWNALSSIYSVDGFAEGERLRLIEQCSREADPDMRFHAVRKAGEYKPLADAVPILCRALCDPCIEVSWQASIPLLEYFWPGKQGPKDKTYVYQGTAVDLGKHGEVYKTARQIHEIRPDLVTKEDLAAIEALRASRDRSVSAAPLWARGATPQYYFSEAGKSAVLRRLPPLDQAILHTERQCGKPKDFVAPEHGAFLHIVNEKTTDGLVWLWRGGEVEERYNERDFMCYLDFRVQSDYVVICSLRLTPETYDYLFSREEVPAWLRSLALQKMDRVDGFAKGARLRLIEMASRDPDLWVRWMAVCRAAEYTPLCDAVPILCRALCDPSIEVSHSACRAALGYFTPVEYKRFGEEIITGSAVEKVMHNEVYSSAQKIHSMRPDLVTKEDLATIELLGYSRTPEAVRKRYMNSRTGAESEKALEKKAEATPSDKPDAKSPKPEPK